MIVLKILFGLVILDLMVIAHELGHYITARIFKVEIKEFAVGMGPKIPKCHWTSKKTGITYSLRAFPVGGFVAMVGEDEESDNPRALNKKPWWQRFIIDIAGVSINIVLGVVLMIIFVMGTSDYNYPSATIADVQVAVLDDEGKVVKDSAGNTVTELGIAGKAGMQKGDKILSINGKKIHIGMELLTVIMLDGIEPLDFIVLRNGEEILIEDVSFNTETEKGLVIGSPDFSIYREQKNFKNMVKHSYYMTGWGIKFVWSGFAGLITGRFGVNQMSGPLGVTEEIGNAAASGIGMLLNLCAIITINFAIFNLLPFPALDGGHAVMRLVEGITKKKVSTKVEFVLNMVGLTILLAFAAFVFLQDIIRLVTR